MKLMERLKKDKKGFTLIEMIVVIVIIGILLAILVPGMFKYIDKAKDKQLLVDARTAYLDIQMAAQEVYGRNGVSIDQVQSSFEREYVYNASGVQVQVPGSSDKVTIDIPKNGTADVKTIDEKGSIQEMTYTLGKKSVEMKGGAWQEPTTITN